MKWDQFSETPWTHIAYIILYASLALKVYLLYHIRNKELFFFKKNFDFIKQHIYGFVPLSSAIFQSLTIHKFSFSFSYFQAKLPCWVTKETCGLASWNSTLFISLTNTRCFSPVNCCPHLAKGAVLFPIKCLLHLSELNVIYNITFFQWSLSFHVVGIVHFAYPHNVLQFYIVVNYHFSSAVKT